ncbi:MAG: site-specific integrase [Deltaproteobacteria bacterium]|nr:tyrosine-type recombinase/integrase [Deltaproteobacteria bacterium]MBM4329539.1 site-specific integrase [Deltaproteobacteria bacterium]
MSVAKRGKTYHLAIRPFGKLIYVATPAETKSEARRIEMAVLTACRSGDYRGLEPVSREVCVRMFRNQHWELSPDLAPQEQHQEKLTLWRAIDLFLNYPGIKESKTRERYVRSLTHLIRAWGKDRNVKSLWIPDLKAYQITPKSEGARPGTINWELATLSKLFGVLIELQHVDVNPVRLVKRLSTKDSEREVYLSREFVTRIADACPQWYRLMIWTAFFSGMRRGELLGLTRRRVNLSRKMIHLGPEHTKEGRRKRVPIHHELVPILEEAMKVTSLESDHVFLIRDAKGVRPAEMEASKYPWGRACEKLGLEKPWPRFHDLRHTWRANARRSGMDPFIAESILGHWFRGRSVNGRYGFVSDEELIRAIDRVSFDHGETVVWVSGKMSTCKQSRKQNVSKPRLPKKKGQALTRPNSLIFFGRDDWI